MKTLLGSILLVLLTAIVAVSSGCAPYPTYYGYGYVYRPAPVFRPIIRCPRYPHWHRHPGGGWIIHRPHAMRPASTAVARPSYEVPASQRVLSPDFGPGEPEKREALEKRLDRLDRKVTAVGKATSAMYEVVKKFKVEMK